MRTESEAPRIIEPVHPSKRKFKRDFSVECKRSFDIAGISYHYWRDSLYTFGENFFDGNYLDLKAEPWNEYDENAIAIYLLGSKLGYVERDNTEEVNEIMLFSKRYSARFRCSERRFEIEYVRDFHNIYTLPYQADTILTTLSIKTDFKKYAEFIKACVGHTITFEEYYFWGSVSRFEMPAKRVAMKTDMDSIMGYIDNNFIQRQYSKTPVAGFIEGVDIDEDNKQVEIKMRLLMEKSVVNKNYQKAYQALEKYFGSFYDGGTYSIPFADLVKVVPRKTRTLSAYEPLMKYLKGYHGTALHIVV